MHADTPCDDGASPTTTTRQLVTLQLGDAPEAWAAAGFDPDGQGRVLLGSTWVCCSGSGAGFEGWAFDGDPSTPADIDGLAAVDHGPADTPMETPKVTHPNGIRSIDHVVVRTGDCERTIAAFVRSGFAVRGGRTTVSHGSPMRQTFFWAGDVILELVGPDEGGPSTDEAASIFGLALVADDLDATAASLGDLLGSPKDAVQSGRRIAGLRNTTVGIGLPIAVMSPHVRP